jgi:hypothetical protein
MTNLRRIQLAIAIAAVGLGVGALLAVAGGQHNIHRGAYAALALGTGWGFAGTGLYAWRRRPASNIGPLMIAVGFAALLKALAFSNDSAIFTIGSLGEVLIYALLIHLLLSFPSGRLDQAQQCALRVWEDQASGRRELQRGQHVRQLAVRPPLRRARSCQGARAQVRGWWRTAVGFVCISRLRAAATR